MKPQRYSLLFPYNFILTLMEFGTCSPKTWHLGIVSIWSGGIWETVCAGRTLIPFWSRSLEPRERCPPRMYPEGSSICTSGDEVEERQEGQAVVSSPSLLLLAHTLCPITLSHNVSLFIKPGRNMLRFNTSLGLHFLRKTPVSCKTFIK